VILRVETTGLRAAHCKFLAEALRAICELDLSELESVEPQHGFGRD
jgi:hypothetical protein